MGDRNEYEAQFKGNDGQQWAFKYLEEKGYDPAWRPKGEVGYDITAMIKGKRCKVEIKTTKYTRFRVPEMYSTEWIDYKQGIMVADYLLIVTDWNNEKKIKLLDTSHITEWVKNGKIKLKTKTVIGGRPIERLAALTEEI